MKKSEYMQACVDSYEEELQELKDLYGLGNVKGFYYSPHRGTWIITFSVGEDEEFESKNDLIERLKWSEEQ